MKFFGEVSSSSPTSPLTITSFRSIICTTKMRMHMQNFLRDPSSPPEEISSFRPVISSGPLTSFRHRVSTLLVERKIPMYFGQTGLLLSLLQIDMSRTFAFLPMRSRKEMSSTSTMVTAMTIPCVSLGTGGRQPGLQTQLHRLGSRDQQYQEG